MLMLVRSNPVIWLTVPVGGDFLVSKAVFHAPAAPVHVLTVFPRQKLAFGLGPCLHASVTWREPISQSLYSLYLKVRERACDTLFAALVSVALGRTGGSC